jgi:hypothetical protein
MTYVTKSGVVVETVGRREMRDGKLKVPCVRRDTKGRHGWLVLSSLRPFRKRPSS